MVVVAVKMLGKVPEQSLSLYSVKSLAVAFPQLLSMKFYVNYGVLILPSRSFLPDTQTSNCPWQGNV
jgi:hypothetical protein